MKHPVFISHSIKDKAIADEVCDFLERNAVSCWIAPRDVLPGKNYGSAIVDAIDECAVFILILTHESNKSGSVAREVERAASANVIIIPFRVEQVQPSKNLAFFVSASHFLDASTKPLEKHLLQLLKAIQNWQGTDVPSQERPPSVLSQERPPSVSSKERPAFPTGSTPAITSNRRPWSMISGPSLAGVVLLAIYLILIGILGLFGVSLGAAILLLPLLISAAGILILVGAFVSAPAIPSNHRRWFMVSAESRAGVILLAIYLILVGLIGIFGVSLGAAGILLPILALVAGIMILLGK